MTENQRLSRRISQLAKDDVRRGLIEKYREEYEGIYAFYKAEKVPSSRRWHYAVAELIERHKDEMSLATMIRREQIARKVGYAPAPRGGFATGKNAGR